MLIKCDLWLFWFVFFSLIAIYSENVVQKFSVELCKNHKKTYVIEVSLKSCRLQQNEERTSWKAFSSEICEIFQNSFFPEQLSVNASVSGAISKQ